MAQAFKAILPREFGGPYKRKRIRVAVGGNLSCPPTFGADVTGHVSSSDWQGTTALVGRILRGSDDSDDRVPRNASRKYVSCWGDDAVVVW
ncbi:hypothetical protein D9615_007980 [Tricholomella constricta]|uniref:Uncharacterized protein n=1 Tax=Tricholomella constricta TaxID=117010 RepID=A0A8H5LZQ3_9AGAR|nr:hypothetical protein D9615_007980 [Tricholomella constricta]